jgi:hypothetical protein
MFWGVVLQHVLRRGFTTCSEAWFYNMFWGVVLRHVLRRGFTTCSAAWFYNMFWGVVLQQEKDGDVRRAWKQLQDTLTNLTREQTINKRQSQVSTCTCTLKFDQSIWPEIVINGSRRSARARVHLHLTRVFDQK